MSLYNEETGKTKNRQGRTKKGFESVGQNFHIIARRLMKSERLMKLLLINESNADSSTRTLTPQEIANAFNDNIRTIPIIDKDTEMKNYIIIQSGGFVASKNEMYMDYLIMFDVVCNVRSWEMDDYTPRPYKIMQEIDNAMNQTKIDSLGPVQFYSATNLVINEEMAGFTLTYAVTSE